jgi:hypothetical protein
MTRAWGESVCARLSFSTLLDFTPPSSSRFFASRPALAGGRGRPGTREKFPEWLRLYKSVAELPRGADVWRCRVTEICATVREKKTQYKMQVMGARPQCNDGAVKWQWRRLMSRSYVATSSDSVTVWNTLNLHFKLLQHCWIWDSQSGGCEMFCLLGNNAL